MNIALTITDAEGAAIGGSVSTSFDEAGGTVGRSSSADWTLPDSKRRVSAQHFRISFQDNHFVLTDTSVNGTFLNDADSPVGKDRSVKLQDGDVLSIGHYTIQVAIVSSESVTGLSPFANEPVRPISGLPDIGGAAGGNPFGDDNKDDLIAQELDPLALLGGGPTKSAEPQLPGAASDHSPILEDFINVPNSAGAAIPDDWNPLAGDDEETELIPRDHQALKSPARVPPADAPAIPDPIPADVPFDSPSIPAAPPAAPAATRGSGDAYAAFLRGANVSPEIFGNVPPEQTMELVGRLFQQTLINMRDLLHARNEVKRGFRLDVTMIQPKENNPLKFSIGDTDEIMRGLFNQRGGGYLGPEEAFEEGFDDIKSHQIGIIAGMRAAFKGLLDRFDPRAIEEAQGSGGLGLTRKSRNWDAYCAAYEELAREAKDDSRFLFGEDFAKAYDLQTRD